MRGINFNIVIMNINIIHFLKIALLIFSVTIFFGVKVVFADWQSNLEAQFDIVETFDNLQNWRGVNGLHGSDYNKSHTPVKLDNSPSMWDFYDEWTYEDPAEDWIKFHGTDKVWRGTGKSLALDLSQNSNHIPAGPSRFGLYFGSATDDIADAYSTSGTKDSGYNNIYMFWMIKMPHNHFPRNDNGEPVYYGYYKLFALCAGFIDANTPAPVTYRNGGQAQVYGPSHILPTIKTGDSLQHEYIIKYGLRVNAWDDWSNQLLYEAYEASDAGYANSSLKPYIDTDTWYGLEIHQTTGTPGNHDAHTEIWLYDSSGNATKIFTKSDGWVQEAGHTYAYNKFFFGGNQDFQSEDGLNLVYYVDDFIIDDQRIGPTYFAMLNNQSIATRADVDNNSQINTTDAMLTLRNSLGLDMSGTNWQSSSTTGDVNCDGTTTSTDAMLILRYSLGLDMGGTTWCVD